MNNFGPLLNTLGGSPSVDICSEPTYATRTQVELIFGSTNVRKWADVENNDDDDTVQARICWALNTSYAYLNDRLFGGPYEVPFDDVPTSLQVMSARYAGVLLYESRGVTDLAEDGQSKHQLSAHRDMVEKFINGVLARRVRFPSVTPSMTVPDVIKDTTACNRQAESWGA